ncbi:MAG: hypothetical protein JXP73_08070 [Deltaproteobacteria bacterium]|jgi:hypothetical protein|nr:hypothetical protein [Deltaproteobacteria bacterium]
MTRIALISMTAIAAMLGAVLPAFAQAPAPAPVYAPAPPPPMAYPAPAPAPAPAPMPGPEMGAVMPVAPVVAPPAADDMTGSVGFGVGVSAGTSSLIIPNTSYVMMKYWLSDALAILPSLSLTMTKIKDVDASWEFAPSVLAMFNLLKGASTRFDAGVGLGLSFGKDPAVADETAIGIGIPVALNVEHFFTRWFSMGLGAGFHLIDFSKLGDSWTMELEVSNINYMGSLFFYTD